MVLGVLYLKIKLGLASALKQKYPLKKMCCILSRDKGDRFHKALQEVDSCLPKNRTFSIY
jgi:hypothetical protein